MGGMPLAARPGSTRELARSGFYNQREALEVAFQIAQSLRYLKGQMPLCILALSPQPAGLTVISEVVEEAAQGDLIMLALRIER